jgi:hypothetical protein
VRSHRLQFGGGVVTRLSEAALEGMRRGVATGAGEASNAEMSTVSLLTSLFERAVWLVRQIGLTLV